LITATDWSKQVLVHPIKRVLQALEIEQLYLLRRAHDGLEREFSSFNRLEGGVCTMCAPRDQRKSINSEREQAEVDALRCQRRAELSAGK
jgi:hypothetical protein